MCDQTLMFRATHEMQAVAVAAKQAVIRLRQEHKPGVNFWDSLRIPSLFGWQPGIHFEVAFGGATQHLFLGDNCLIFATFSNGDGYRGEVIRLAMYNEDQLKAIESSLDSLVWPQPNGMED